MTELADHDVERGRLEWQVLDVPFAPVDLHGGQSGILTRDRQQLRREIEAGHLRAAARRRHRDDAGPARDIEHALPRLDPGVTDEMRGRFGRDRLERCEVGPPGTLGSFETVEVVHPKSVQQNRLTPRRDGEGVRCEGSRVHGLAIYITRSARQG